MLTFDLYLDLHYMHASAFFVENSKDDGRSRGYEIMGVARTPNLKIKNFYASMK